jgi:chromate transporter
MSNISLAEKPSFREALAFWSKLGWISFGGTAGHIAIMHDYLVEQKKWISNERFLHALSLCMILPGPEAQQLAIYIGWQLHGKRGGLAAGILFVLPSMFILLVLSIIYVSFGTLAWISAMFGGLKPAVIAVIIIALFKIAEKALRGLLHVFVATIAFIAMFFFNVSLLLLMLGAVTLAVVVASLYPSLFHTKNNTHEEEDEHGYYINRYSVNSEAKFNIKYALKVTIAIFSLWLMPLPLFFFFTKDFHFWRSIVLFFTKTAFVTIGGSYTVLPYVAQLSVTKLHWLTKLQMMDGFALAETTPGPLIIVLTFVGFIAGYNHFHGSLWMGAIGLVTTTFYTFLPCFLFVFVGAPVVTLTQGKPVIEAILGLITAVVVGAILDLTLFLGSGVVFPSGKISFKSVDIISVIWMLISLLLLQKAKLKVIYLILLSILFGLTRSIVASHPW